MSTIPRSHVMPKKQREVSANNPLLFKCRWQLVKLVFPTKKEKTIQ